ncbi:tripartite tricarboxylate transporter TctB family protein [Alcaligenaceae bacterium]|nr:tripartite tricarboxylate transporter TctB family protein [Alcaligenaceae bacterium]
MRNEKDLYAGLLSIGIGAATIAESLSYKVGRLANMGPGYFPIMIGVGLVILGSIMLVHGIASPGQTSKMKWKGNLRAVVAIMFGLLAFAFLGKYGGFIPATTALIVISALGDPNNSPKMIFFLSIGVLVPAIIIFNLIIRMPFPLFQWS